MTTERPTCREASGDTSDRGIEASWIDPASRSASEPEEASLHKVRAANMPDCTKPETHCEAMFTSSNGALRGEKGQRVGKVWLGRLGDLRCRNRKEVKQNTVRIHKERVGNGGVGEARSSREIPIKSGWSEGALVRNDADSEGNWS